MASEAAVQKRPQVQATRRREEDPDAIHEARQMGHVQQREEAAE
jgi:hypothetical protein